MQTILPNIKGYKKIYSSIIDGFDQNTFCEKLVFVGSMELARVLRHRHRGGHLHEDVDDDGKRTMKEMIY